MKLTWFPSSNVSGFKNRAHVFCLALLLSLAASAAVFASPASTTAVPAVLAQGAEGLSPKVLAMALNAVAGARDRGISGKSDLLTVIDYSLPSNQPRLWVLDLSRGKVLFHELVAHGAGRRASASSSPARPTRAATATRSSSRDWKRESTTVPRNATSSCTAPGT